MRPFQLWDGNLTRDAYKAMVLQLNPDDYEAEQAIRMAVEARAARNIRKGLREWLREVMPANMTEAELSMWEYRLQNGKAKFRDVLSIALQDSVDLGVNVAIDQFESVGFGFDWTLANTSARNWAERYTDDLLAGITNTTRRGVGQAVARWTENGEPLPSLIKDLEPLFGKQRAELIASTEVTRAYAEGNRIAYRESGVVDEIEWRTAKDERVCPICGPLDGKQRRFGEPFDIGIDAPPAHPRCRCWVVPVIAERKQ